MANIVDVVFNPEGIVVYLDDNTVAEGKLKTVNGQVRLVGIESDLRIKLQAFYLNRDESADADIRYFGLSSIIIPDSTDFSSDTDVLFSCPASVVVPDAVYISSPGTVDKASAESGIGQTGDAIAIVTSKPTSITCTAAFFGVVEGFTGLSPGIIYYLSQISPGAIISVAPSGSGQKRQRIGIAATSTQLTLQIGEAILIG